MSDIAGPPVAPRQPGPRAFDALIVGLIFLAYTTTISVALDMAIGPAMAAAAANTIPVVIFGAIARTIIRNRLIGKRTVVQILGHVLLCTSFSLLSFWLLIVLLGLVNGISPTAFVVRPFPTSGTAWQMLETVTTYGMIAALAYVPVQPPHRAASIAGIPVAAPMIAERGEVGSSRHFIRSGEDIRPIDFDRVVSLAGADDYAEITSLDGTHLVRMTLAEFEKTLDQARFARVHRSWIVNIDHIARAEPAGGGRMLLHMGNGQRIPASRTGARLLRNRVI